MSEEMVHLCDVPLGLLRSKCGERAPNEPFTLTLNGVEYRLDMCQMHQDQLLDAISVYVEGVRPPRVRKGKGGKGGTFTTKDVRLWAQEQGLDVAPSGRLPNELIERYKKAQSR